jgi:hypothetical protein
MNRNTREYGHDLVTEVQGAGSLSSLQVVATLRRIVDHASSTNSARSGLLPIRLTWKDVIKDGFPGDLQAYIESLLREETG